jgi:hypothetical protein
MLGRKLMRKEKGVGRMSEARVEEDIVADLIAKVVTSIAMQDIIPLMHKIFFTLAKLEFIALDPKRREQLLKCLALPEGKILPCIEDVVGVKIKEIDEILHT